MPTGFCFTPYCCEASDGAFMWPDDVLMDLGRKTSRRSRKYSPAAAAQQAPLGTMTDMLMDLSAPGGGPADAICSRKYLPSAKRHEADIPPLPLGISTMLLQKIPLSFFRRFCRIFSCQSGVL